MTRMERPSSRASWRTETTLSMLGAQAKREKRNEEGSAEQKNELTGREQLAQRKAILCGLTLELSGRRPQTPRS